MNLTVDQVDVIIYGCVNANPTITAEGVSYLWKGIALEEIKRSLARLRIRGFLARADDGTFEVIKA